MSDCVRTIVVGDSITGWGGREKEECMRSIEEDARRWYQGIGVEGKVECVRIIEDAKRKWVLVEAASMCVGRRGYEVE